jgi:2'-5' RNA ligase
MEATGFSLWLMPEGSTHERFGEIIARLSGRHGTPGFEPHVTLLGELPGPEELVLERCADLVRHLRPLTLHPLTADHGDTYFHCVFVTVELTPDLRAARERALELLGGHDVAFHPHLSLLYGDFSVREKETVVAEVTREIGGPFEVRAIDVVATMGAPESWRRSGRFVLGGAAP